MQINLSLFWNLHKKYSAFSRKEGSFSSLKHKLKNFFYYYSEKKVFCAKHCVLKTRIRLFRSCAKNDKVFKSFKKITNFVIFALCGKVLFTVCAKQSLSYVSGKKKIIFITFNKIRFFDFAPQGGKVFTILIGIVIMTEKEERLCDMRFSERARWGRFWAPI